MEQTVRLPCWSATGRPPRDCPSWRVLAASGVRGCTRSRARRAKSSAVARCAPCV